MDRAELLAKAIIEQLVDGAQMHFQEVQDAGQHDFDLLLPEGEIAAVEVTTSADQELECTSASIREPKKGGSFVPTSKCKKDWTVHPLKEAKIANIRKNVDTYLAAIEATGIERFFSQIDAVEYPLVMRIFCDLRIEAGSVTKWKKPGQIRIAPPGGGGMVDSSEVQNAVYREASKKDNRRKLSKSGRRQRHLFVYVHPRNYLPWVSLVDTCPPLGEVFLPEEITHIWVSVDSRDKNEFVVWRAQNGSEWSNSGTVEIDPNCLTGP